MEVMITVVCVLWVMICVGKELFSACCYTLFCCPFQLLTLCMCVCVALSACELVTKAGWNLQPHQLACLSLLVVNIQYSCVSAGSELVVAAVCPGAWRLLAAVCHTIQGKLACNEKLIRGCLELTVSEASLWRMIVFFCVTIPCVCACVFACACVWQTFSRQACGVSLYRNNMAIKYLKAEKQMNVNDFNFQSGCSFFKGI